MHHTSIFYLENSANKAVLLLVGIFLLISCLGCDPREYKCGATDIHFVSNETEKHMVYEIVVERRNHEIIINDTAYCTSPSLDTNNGWLYARCDINGRLDSVEMFTVIRKPQYDVFPKDCSGVRGQYDGVPSRFFLGPVVYNLTDTMSIQGRRTGLFGSVLGKYVSVTTAPGGGNMNTNYCHLHITDEMLGEMQKDYNMLEKFPEYYGKKR